VNSHLDSFNKALRRLAEALDAPPGDLVRDASIQRFEFTFELAWKAIKNTATVEGLECMSPCSCLKLAFGQGWVDDEPIWLAMLEDRNRASHTYDETHPQTGCPGVREQPVTPAGIDGNLRLEPDTR
jgi:nucleotidyltransferase substrate binding protein (TIGR01987 family)